MDVLGAALPNLMFLVGIAALSIGLGIELKIVPVNNQVPRSGRIGAMVIGAGLVVFSVILYNRPSAIATTPTTQPAVAQEAAATFVPLTATPPQPTALPATAAPPSPIAGTTVSIEGIIQELQVTATSTQLVVNAVGYSLSPELIALFGPYLQVGMPIRFVGQYTDAGQVVITTITHLNNQVVEIVKTGPGNNNGTEEDDD